MNPETNIFEMLAQDMSAGAEHGDKIVKMLRKHQSQLVRPNGQPVPEHWTQFSVGEQVVIKDYTFRVAYIGESVILFEPVGIPIVGGK